MEACFLSRGFRKRKEILVWRSRPKDLQLILLETAAVAEGRVTIAARACLLTRNYRNDYFSTPEGVSRRMICANQCRVHTGPPDADVLQPHDQRRTRGEVPVEGARRPG